MRNTIFSRSHCLMLIGSFFLSSAALLVIPTAARAKVLQNEIQDLGDPNAMYGNCGSRASGLERKTDLLIAAGVSLKQIYRVFVIDCHGFDGGGGAFVVPCPAGTSFSYCVQSQNDGLGNHILVGVITSPAIPCTLMSRRLGPPAQIDITFLDPAFGIATVEFRGGITNAQVQPYAVINDRARIIVTATKIDQSQPASLSNILVRNGANITTTCNFSF
jgi:hypothetical protein